MTPAAQLAAQAAQWQAAGRPDMAVPLYAASLEQDPTNVMARWQLADCLSYLQQPDQAATHYLQVAQAHALLGRGHDCLAVCERVLQLAPHAFVYTAVGPTMRLIGRRIGREARTVCARAAQIHLHAGRQTEGLQILRLGAELDATSPEVRLQLARIYKSRGMIREAVEAMADAGDLLLQARRLPEYARVAELLLTLDPEHLDTLRELPRAYLELRRPHDAVRMLGQLTRVSPGDIVGYEVLAQAFAFIGHTDKALSVLERLVDELTTLGRGSKADAILEHARAWRPSDLGFQRALRRMEIPKPASARPPAPAPQDMPPEGTVVLSIADLIADQSRACPAPTDEGVELTEVEGTLSLDLGDLMRYERRHAASRAASAPASSPPPPPPPPPRAEAPVPGPDDVEISLSLDASALIEALANDVPLHELAKLVYDDESDDEPNDDPGESDEDEHSTALDLKALTAKDLARGRPTVPQDEDAPTMAHMQALTPADLARGLARPGGGPPPPPPPRRPSFDEEVTMTPRTKGAKASPPPIDEDAMTLAKMDALTPEDIASALRRQGKR